MPVVEPAADAAVAQRALHQARGRHDARRSALLRLLPVIAVVAMAIKLDCRGPVFFRQERLGRGGRVFRIVKFRTMVLDAEAAPRAGRT